MTSAREQATSASEFVTVMIGTQSFGLAIARVQDVFVLQQMTRVPLAPPDIAGMINLRGRIITTIDVRRRLGLPDGERRGSMAVGINGAGDFYGLIVDAVGEVLKLGTETEEPVPANFDERLKRVATSVHRLEAGLLVVLDVDRLLELKPVEKAA